MLSRFRKSKLVGGSAFVLLFRVVNVFTAFGLSVFLLRSLGLEGFGLYAIYLAIMALVVLPITAGLPNLIVRKTSPAFAEGDRDEIRGVIGLILRILLVYFAILTVVGIVVYQWAPEWLSLVLLVLLWLHVIFQVLAAMRSAILRAAGHIVRGQLLERLVQPVLTLVFNAAAFAHFQGSFTVEHAVIALLGAHFVTFVTGGIWVRRYAFGPGPRKPVDAKQLIKETLQLSGSGLLSSILMNGVVLLISAFASVEATGLYRIAASVALPLIYVHEVLGQVVAPRLAQHWHQGNYVALARILRVGALASFATVVLGVIALTFVGRPLLIWAYGPESAVAFIPMMILALAHAANAAGGFDHDVLNMSGNSDVVLRATFILITAVMAIAVPMIDWYQATGAAVALLLYQVMGTLWFARETKKIVGTDPSIFVFLRARKNENK